MPETRTGFFSRLSALAQGTWRDDSIVNDFRSTSKVTSLAAPAASTQSSRAPALNARSVAGKRVSVDSEVDIYANTLAVMTPFSAHDYWRGMKLDARTLDKIPPAKLLELMVDISPEVSRALFDFLTMFNSGYEVHAFTPGTTTENAKGKAALDAIMQTLKVRHGSPKIVFDRLAISGFMRGSYFAEVILGANGKDFLDLATPDPLTLRFKKAKDPVLGVYWQYGQYQNGEFVRLDDETTVKYVPIHPLPGQIEGRSPAHSSLFVCLFLLVLLHDLRRVIQQQGYPRIDVKVIFEKLRDAMPAEAESDPTEFAKWADQVVAEVKAVMDSLEPDDTYIHGDAIEVGQPVGTMNAAGLGVISELFKALERMATRALKTMPLNMATTDGASEANANRQWEMYAKGISSLQHACESLLELLLEVALQAQGVNADVVFKFAELRAAEELRDAQTQQKKIENARAAYDNGLINMDEQAMMALGKEKADAAEPRNLIAPAPQDNFENPEPGSARAQIDAEVMKRIRAYASRLAQASTVRSPTTAELDRSLDFWRTFAPAIAEHLPEAEVANNN